MTGAVEATETRLVEFAGDVAFTLVVAVKWIEGGRAGTGQPSSAQTLGMNGRHGHLRRRMSLRSGTRSSGPFYGRRTVRKR